ncbi:unnamed protein product [Brassica rapa]|uniref:Uncharacterized protein n=1 Tax=Brassica campestris TaxID=3711 RepID=A0A3P5YHH0_BRACM|nr:unnamed protein product [Brassica rapa]VDC67162.1 unnamed protein product [Brassica rapa]
MFSHGHSSQKRKRKPSNDENDNSQARSQKTNSSLGVVFEDVTNIPRIQDNEFRLEISPTKNNGLHRDVGSTSLRMLKNRIRQTPRNLTSSIIQDGIESQISIKNPTQSATWGCNDTTTSQDQRRILTSNSEAGTPLKRRLGYQRKISHIQDINMTPISTENIPPSNHSIPLKSIFGRVLNDITNPPQSVGFGSQVVQNRTILSPMYGTHSQSPYVTSTIMASCNNVVEGQYHQDYDLSTEESDAYSDLSSHGAHIFNSVEKFDFQAIIKRKKAQDAKKAESKLKTIAKTGLKMIGNLLTNVRLLFHFVLQGQ